MEAMLDGVPLGCAVGALLGDSVEAMLDGVPLGSAVGALLGDSATRQGGTAASGKWMAALRSCWCGGRKWIRAWRYCWTGR